MTRNFEPKIVVIVVVIFVMVLFPWQSASGQANQQNEKQSVVDLAPVAELFADYVHPNVLARANIDSSSFGPTLQQVIESQERLVENERLVSELSIELEKQTASEAWLSKDLEVASTELDDVNHAVSVARDELAGLAIAAFQNPAHPRLLEYVATGEINSDPVLVRQASDQMKASHRDLLDDQQRKELRRQQLASSLLNIQESLARTRKDLDNSHTQIGVAQQTIAELTPQLISKVLLAQLTDLPFPVVVLDAYYKAQLSTAATKPDCQVSWSQLAGIGKVETVHGTYGSAVVTRDGRTSTKILGPQLDGDPFLAIPDTDAGQLDGNDVWDHAVGPMQFIPSSWSLYGADGNRDNIKDPHNIYDAALAAANHLCGSRNQLATPANFTRALLGYNRSVAYGNEVKHYVAEYSTALHLPG